MRRSLFFFLFLSAAAGAPLALWAAARAAQPASAGSHPVVLAPQEAEPPAADPGANALQSALAAAGLKLDLERGLLALPCEVDITDDLLEYLLVGPNGAAHESLLVTHAQPSLVNAALLALGLEPGRNVRYVTREPQPSLEEIRAGARRFDVELPSGPGLHFHLGWREGAETYFFRIEDLIANARTRRAMQRHRWTYIGSRFIAAPGGGEVFAADSTHNLINIAFFQEGNTLFTAGLEECTDQTIWAANPWLVPETGMPVLFVASRAALERAPEHWLEHLPDLVSARAAAARAGASANEDAQRAAPAAEPAADER
jgi:hypothetical protein